MSIDKLCDHGVATVCASDELMTAATIMRERHVGFLVIIEAREDADDVLRAIAGKLTDMGDAIHHEQRVESALRA